MSLVAGPGIAPGLGDYEPPVRLYTTPRLIRSKHMEYTPFFASKQLCLPLCGILSSIIKEKRYDPEGWNRIRDASDGASRAAPLKLY